MTRVLRRAACWAAVGVVVTMSAAGHGSGQTPAPTSRESSGQVARCIRDPGCHRTFVVVHRGHGLGAPENSREAVTRALAAGVPLIKIDVRAAQDGGLFLLHDGKLDRTTTLKGRIESLTSAAVAEARLANGETLPRFADVYEIARGRAILVVGFKSDAVQQAADWIHAHGSFDDLVFFVNTGEEMQAAARAKTRYPAMIVMVRLLDTRVTVESTRAVFGRLPEIFHTDRVGAERVANLHALGVKVFMNVVPWEGYVQPVKHIVVGWILRTRLDFVLTDEPVAMMRRLSEP
jgi:glycerophosphoryl diester phosphodiesterase